MLMTPSKVSAHVRFMLLEFNDSDDYHSLAQEICDFFDYGVETSICVLKTCVDCFVHRKNQANALQLEGVISLVLKRVLVKPNFETLLLQALNDVEVTEEFVNDTTSALHFSSLEKICFGLSLTYSERSDASTSGRSFCMAEIDRLCANPVQMESAEQIQNILLFLQLSEGHSKLLDSFIRILPFSQSSDTLQFVFKPILSAGVHEADVFRCTDFLDKTLQKTFDGILTEFEKDTNVGDLIEELGYGFTADASLCKEILSHFLPLTEATILRILVAIVRAYAVHKDDYNTFATFRLSLGSCSLTELPTLTSWNVDILFETIKQLAPSTSWIKVIENLDHEGFDIPNMEVFAFFMMVVRSICKDPFPLHAICSFVWKNMEGQLSFLKHAVSAPPEMFTFVHSARKLAYTDSMHSNDQLGLSNYAWLSLDLLNILCQLAERGLAASVRSLVQYPLSHCPKTLLLGMAHIKTAYNVIQREVVSAILPGIMKNTQDSSFILKLWQLNREFVIWGLFNAQNLEPDSMLGIIDIFHEHEILSSVIELVPLSFGIRMAMLASERGFLDIEKWLSDCHLLFKDVFFEECLKVIKDIHSSDPISNLSLEATYLFLKVLRPHTNVITSPRLFDEIETVLKEILECTSKIQNGETENSSASSVSKCDVESEANSYFQRMFSGEMSADEIVQMLSQYKDSSNKSFFSEYPERQLKTAAILFGSVIKHQLLTSLTLGVALRAVLDSLRKPVDSKMFLFGTKALEQFVNNIELREYCSHILLISHLHSTHPDLVAVVEQRRSRISPGESESDTSVPHPGRSQSFPTNGEGLGLKIVDTLVSAVEEKDNSVEAPPSEVMDKIYFIINNLSEANVNTKVKEFTEFFPIQYYPWFAQYIVTKRACIEENFQKLYLEFLEKVNSRPLYSEILQATYVNCKVRLGSELIKSNIDERTLLKNLGSWLGKVTIGRNNVLRAREIDPKSLIVDAYEKGLLIAIIPFTSKVLEPCRSSIAYQPPNPWTMCILELLSEVYSLPNLIINLKFEIEIFFKKIGVNIQDVKPTSLLKDRKREIDGNLDFSKKHFGVAQESQSQMIDELKSENLSPRDQHPAPLPISPGRLVEDEKVNALNSSDHLPTVIDETFSISQLSAQPPNTGNHVIISPKLSTLNMQVHFQRVVVFSMERAIKKVVSCFVHPSVFNARKTTLILVFKDYASEQDETCIYNAARIMVANLAGKLARVTCKERLRAFIEDHLRHLLQGLHISTDRSEEVVQLITNDNLELGCDAIERVAAEKAIQEIYPDIAQQLLLRKEQSDETVDFQRQVFMLFAEWCQICELPGENVAACTRYILHLYQSGLLDGSDKTESFFRILTEYSVAQWISTVGINSGAREYSQQVQNLSFIAVDIYAKLVYYILKESRCKSLILSKIMSVTVRSMFKDADDNKTSLNPRAYFRLFINWLLDLLSLDPVTDGSNCQVLIAFADVFHDLQPLNIPGFCFAWLELVSHRSFMPKLLSLNGRKGWPYAQRLLVDLLQFLEPFLRNAELREPVNLLYKGTLKVLLVLLHDYPEFLCDYHFTFCNVIPPSCIQMRNIFLSSFPRDMRLPDPSTPDLKIDLLPEIVEAPCILSEVDAALKEKQMKGDLDDYLSMRQHDSSFLNELKQRLLLSTSEAISAGTRYNIPLVNSLVLYAGQQAIQHLQAGVTENEVEAQCNVHVASWQMFMLLSLELDTEGRYLLLNAIANQLRYPNNHTHHFSFIMLYLFSESEQEIIKEQITRVLLERPIVNRPHPWGLLITFIELTKNPRYGFWGQGFVRCAPPEIATLLESVARSCGDLKPVDGLLSHPSS